MAVVKLTAKGTAVQFIDEEGNVFGTSKTFMKLLLDGTLRGNFILLTRMPWKASVDRFKKSPLYDDKSGTKIDSESTSSDALSIRGRDTVAQAKQYTDDDIIL